MRKPIWRRRGKVLALAGAAVLVFAASVQAFPTGTWVNVNPRTRGIVKLMIARRGSVYMARGFGACHPRPCDWKWHRLDIGGKSITSNVMYWGISAWSESFKRVAMVIYVGKNKLLRVIIYNVFTDRSNRKNYEQKATMKRP